MTWSSFSGAEVAALTQGESFFAAPRERDCPACGWWIHAPGVAGSSERSQMRTSPIGSAPLASSASSRNARPVPYRSRRCAFAKRRGSGMGRSIGSAMCVISCSVRRGLKSGLSVPSASKR